jgi:hypothetical protein
MDNAFDPPPRTIFMARAVGGSVVFLLAMVIAPYVNLHLPGHWQDIVWVAAAFVAIALADPVFIYAARRWHADK